MRTRVYNMFTLKYIAGTRAKIIGLAWFGCFREPVALWRLRSWFLHLDFLRRIHINR